MSTPKNLTRRRCESLTSPCAGLEYATLHAGTSGLSIQEAYAENSGRVRLRLVYEFGVPRHVRTTVDGKRPEYAWLNRCPFCGVELQPIVISDGTVQDEPSEKPDAHGEVSA